jgi:MoaA/NifB/PqqE/SkfB family radical SAM enzyme
MKYFYKKTIYNLFFEYYGKLYAKISRHFPRILNLRRTPLSVQIEVTNFCNMTCPHCSRQHFMDRDVGSMNIDLFKSVVNEISTFPWCHLRIGGLGEPSLHPNIQEMLDYLKKRLLKVEIITNGTLLRKFTPIIILDWEIDILGISIDGHDEASYKQHRPGGNYQDLRQKVIALCLEKKKIGATYPEIRIRNVLFPDYTTENVSIFKKNWLPFVDYIQFNTLNPGYNTEVLSPLFCTEIDSVIHIRWDGSVPLCGYQHWCTKEESLGNLLESSLKNLWLSDRLQDLRRAHRNANLTGFEFCKRCYHTQWAYLTHENAIQWNQHKNSLISYCRRKLKSVEQRKYRR